MFKPRALCLVMATALSPFVVHANDQAFDLGRIEVTADKALPGTSTASAVIDANTMREENRETVAQAVNRLPGVSLSYLGGRNEAMASIRGFNLRQVPVLIDGIPVYVPYDGYVDLNRFTTYDLAEINVSKSFSSPLLGANALGGAINLVSRRPTEKLEGEIGAGYNTGDHSNSEGQRGWLNVGTNQGLWYGQFSASYLNQDSFSLSDDFRADNPASPQDNGVRDNAYKKDTKINFKLGLTPNETDEYAIGYVKQDGEKGTPPYTGNRSNTRYWQWPYWDKESVYFLSNTALSDSSYIKTRLYYDTFENLLSSYDNANYNTQNARRAFNSFYDDYTYGASVEYGNTLGAHQLKVAAHYKFDQHKEHDQGEPTSQFEDRTVSFGIEDTITLTEQLYLVLGASYDKRKIMDAYKYYDDSGRNGFEQFDHDDNGEFNPQIGLFAELDEANQARVTLSQKSRFATIKDRYSGSFGSRLPNEDLKPEKATTLELGWVHKLAGFGRIEASVFQSRIEDLIQGVQLTPAELAANPTLDSDADQNRNIGRVDARGFELAGDFWFNNWELGGNYSYLTRNNRSSSDRLIDTPRHKVFVYADWHLTDPFSLGMTTQFESERYNSSDAQRKSSAFALTGLRATYAHPKGVTTRVGIENLFDKDYSYDEGYPEAGRTYYANVSYSF